LVRRGLVESRSAARRAIEAALVEVAGVPEPRAATLVDPATPVNLVSPARTWASRGGDKLAAALDAFGIDPTGKRALDVGASTGGFTDVLLTRGAAEVTSVDVGYGQLAWRLRRDPRIRVVDRTNFRHVDVTTLGAPFDLVVADVSFISLTLLAAQLRTAGSGGADYVLLVKPQFEVGKDQVGRGGIVTDPSLHRSAITAVADSLAAAGLGAVGVLRSPIRGAKGNREFLLHARPGAPRPLDREIDEVIAP
jgi:23S rRNA (cytidine1920-2'-O)/16S rRNA (cytidine1409-2'-O)-methyltransferase